MDRIEEIETQIETIQRIDEILYAESDEEFEEKAQALIDSIGPSDKEIIQQFRQKTKYFEKMLGESK